MTNVALIVAAGTGSRSGSPIPKQFAPLAGRAMVAWSHAAFAAHPAIDHIVVAVAPGQEALLDAAIPGAARVTGGARRQDSVAAGIAAAAALGATRLLIHDAARPFVSAAVIDRLLAALDASPGAVPVLAVADTLLSARGETIPRDGLYRVQTPQAFRHADVARAHAQWRGGEATDDAQMLRASGLEVALVEGDSMLEKITYPADFATAAARAGVGVGAVVRAAGGALWETRSASGFDVHRLVDGAELWLGGVRIAHHQGLSGHSDADVALHAITDAVLGTIAAGDIGTHFPPSAPQWRGAESGQFLAHARDLVAAAGGRVTFVDLTLMCEAPKIGPHRAAMQARIAGLLHLTPDRVSVKATTTERLGFTGRGEGIAAQAVATVALPLAPATAQPAPEALV